MGTGPRQLPAAKLGLGKWLQARRKARRARRKAPPRTGVPPSFLSEALGCQKSRQGITRRLAAGPEVAALGRRGIVASARGCGPCRLWELLAREAPRQGWWTPRWRQGRRHSFTRRPASEQKPKHPCSPHFKLYSKGTG